MNTGPDDFKMMKGAFPDGIGGCYYARLHGRHFYKVDGKVAFVASLDAERTQWCVVNVTKPENISIVLPISEVVPDMFDAVMLLKLMSN